MPTKHDTALASVRGLLGFVAALGITNTLHQLIKTTPEPLIHLTHFTTEISRQVGRDLGHGRLLPFLLAVCQIIIAFRFYQSSTVLIEDRHPTLPPPTTDAESRAYSKSRRYFAVHVIGFISEGLLVATASFYIHSPCDFALLFSILFVGDGLLTLLRNYCMEPVAPGEVKRQARWWFWWNFLLGLFLFLWSMSVPDPGIGFFVGVVVAIAVNTVVVVSKNFGSYFPMSA